MLEQTNPQHLTVIGLSHRCADESNRFFSRQPYNPRYCYELFRRAVVERNEYAWELIYRQYQALVAGWVRRHEAFSGSGEEVPFFVNRAFEKVWTAVTPEKFAHFPDLKSLLGYLATCVNSVLMDNARVQERRSLEVEMVDDRPLMQVEDADHPSPEEEAGAELARQRFWQMINDRLADEKEQQVIYCLYSLGLKPREIFAQRRDLFGDVTEVYRARENVLARLGRDAELRQWFEVM